MTTGQGAWACCDGCGAMIPDSPKRARKRLADLLEEYGWANLGMIAPGGGHGVRCAECRRHGRYPYIAPQLPHGNRKSVRERESYRATDYGPG